jgi:hypothetical protein
MMPEAEAWVTPCPAAFVTPPVCPFWAVNIYMWLHWSKLLPTHGTKQNPCEPQAVVDGGAHGPTDQIKYKMIRDVQ